MEIPVMEVVTSFLGSLGFAVVFNISRRKIFPAAMNGLLVCLVYYGAHGICGSELAATTAASFFAAVYAEAAARLFRSPANQFLIAGIIPLLPGSALYYTLDALFAGNYQAAKSYAGSMTAAALGIAVGICAVSGFIDIVRNVRTKRHNT